MKLWKNKISIKERDYNSVSNYSFLDRGDLAQTIIIIAGLAVAAVFAIGGVATVLMSKGETAANCIANRDEFRPDEGINMEQCKNVDADSHFPDNNDNSPGGNNNGTGDTVNIPGNELMIRSDLNSFSEKVQEFYNTNGHYPGQRNELKDLNYQATLEAYPSEYEWNLEYCYSEDNQEYIITAYAGENNVIYVSSNNNTPITYNMQDELIKYTRDGEWTGGYVSPCYSGTPYSAADRAGLNQIGELDENMQVIGTHGTSGIGSNGLSDWASNGTN